MERWKSSAIDSVVSMEMALLAADPCKMKK
jgi:hypothetical protein